MLHITVRTAALKLDQLGVYAKLPHVGILALDGWSALGWLRDFRGTGSGLSTWSSWSEARRAGEVKATGEV